MRPPDPLPLCRALNDAGCEYVLIGGFAVGVHGYPRGTDDSDVLLAPGPENWARTLDAVIALGGRLRDGSPIGRDLAVQPHLRFEGEECGSVDLLQEGGPPLTFAELRADALVIDLDVTSVPVVGLVHLIALKRLAGRTRDLADIEELERGREDLPRLPIPGVDLPAAG